MYWLPVLLGTIRPSSEARLLKVIASVYIAIGNWHDPPMPACYTDT